jgi:integrase
MRMKLTDRAVARLKRPASGKVDVWDVTLPAFGIQLRATGRRAWIIAVRRPGKTTTSRIKIGDPATMPLAEARQRAQGLMRNPSALEMPANPEAASDNLTGDSPVATVVADFIQRDQKPRNRSWRAVQQILAHDLTRWGRRPLRTITKADVLDVLDRVVDRGSPSMANLLLAHIKRMFNWAIERGLIEASPAHQMRPPSPKVERERVLTDPELRAVWHGAAHLGWPFGPVMHLLMLTGQREGEVAAMRWADLDLDQALWMLTSRQTKAGRAHLVPLSSAAVQILQILPHLGAFVFPGRRTDGARPVCGFSNPKLRLDKICGVEDWVFHDLRRTAATVMAQLKVPPHVTEKILNHRSAETTGPIGKIYQRYNYLEERRTALELWATTLTQIVTTGNRGNPAQWGQDSARPLVPVATVPGMPP